MHSSDSNSSVTLLGPSTANGSMPPAPSSHHHPFKFRKDPTSPSNDASGNNPQLAVILTVRMLMQGKEVGSIIGKRGDYVRQIREQSGAKINISDGSSPERIVTISGPAEAINKAFTMVANKFEEDLQALQCPSPKPPITLRLLIPASQCGSLIGKGGIKIREIRDKTSASLQVASEMLSNSTEKPVTISGSGEALIGCMREVCQILLDAPAKGPTIQYKPVNQGYNPLAMVSSAAAIAAAAAAAQQQKGPAAPGGQIQMPVGAFPQAALLHQSTANAMANPLLSLQEQLALLQHHHHQFNPNPNIPFHFDPALLSRFLLQSNGSLAGFGAGAIAPVSSALSIPNVSSAGTLPTALLVNPLTTIPISSSIGNNTQQQAKMSGGLELFGSNNLGAYDSATLASLLAQQQQHGHGGAMDATSAVAQQQAQQAALLQQQQQHIQMLYQQQQQQNGTEAAATNADPQITGRTIGTNGQPMKGSAGSAATSQKRFTPY